MSVFLSLLFSFLLLLDPLGYSLVQGRQVVEKSFPNHAATAIYADGHTEIWFDAAFLEQVYGDSVLSRAWAACDLVQEGANARAWEKWRDTSEEFGLLYHYICLDRVQAPAWMKEYVYKLLQEKVSKDK